MGLTAAVAGASGYAGGELLRLLAGHPHIDIGPLAAGASAGQRVTAVHPQLVSLGDRSFAPTEPRALEADLVFLALPHGESAAIARGLPGGPVVIDLAADHRLADADQWANYYSGAHAGRWQYGLPELPGHREDIAKSRRIAAPGCYATAVILALAPLLRAGLVAAEDVVVTAASGASGAGRAAKDHLLASQVMGDVSAYKVAGTHQHIPEIAQALEIRTLTFTPLLVPMPRGILATVTARTKPGIDTGVLHETMDEAYAGEPFVHVLPEGTWPHTAATVGTNAAQLQVAADTGAGRATVVCAIDNLGKGAAGQAVQAANIALGLPETSGLSTDGVAP